MYAEPLHVDARSELVKRHSYAPDMSSAEGEKVVAFECQKGFQSTEMN